MTQDDRLAVLVHELRSPIAALQAIAESAAAGALAGETGRRLLGLAVEAVRNIDRLVVDPALMSFHPVAIDLSVLAGNAVEAATVAGRSVVLEQGAGDHRARVDPVRVRQALDNLISNAVSHSPPSASVRVFLRDSGKEVEIGVADEGDGIGAGDQARVFDAGVRLTSSRPGSGIGLAVVKAVATVHGGRVELVSAVGAGSTFTLVLPRGAVPPG